MYFEEAKVDVGRCTAILKPVPRITANRVAGSSYARDNNVADESFTMESNLTGRFYICIRSMVIDALPVSLPSFYKET